MSSSKTPSKHYIVPQDFFYCIDFFAQPKNRQHTSSINYAAPKPKLTMDLVSAIETERKTEDKVARWLGSLPDRFSRVPGDSRSKVREAQLQQLERERDVAHRMLLAQQPQPQFNNTEQRPPVYVEVNEYLSLIEPDRQRLLDHWDSETKEAKGQRHMRHKEEQPGLLSAKHFETSMEEPHSRERVETEEWYFTEAALPPADAPPPPIPPRSMLRPSIATFSETAPGSIWIAEPINASSSQYSSVDVLSKEAAAKSMSGVVRDLEMGIRRDNPGLVAELRLGMERRRLREKKRDEDLEKEREKEVSKTKVWGLKLWK